MSFTINCPYFSVGNCTSYKEGKCKYKHHKRCSKNFLCDNENCKYGHGISVLKRLIVNKVYDIKYDIKTSVYETSENKCDMPMNCTKEECKNDHHLQYIDRSFIYKIANIIITDEEAWNLYEEKYYIKDSFKEDISLYSPISDIMSSGSTMSPGPVFTKSFASLLKETKDEIEIEEDDYTFIMDEMLEIRKELSNKNKKIIDIKENIEKLKQELVIAEVNVKIEKDKLKEYAIQIVNS